MRIAGRPYRLLVLFVCISMLATSLFPILPVPVASAHTPASGASAMETSLETSSPALEGANAAPQWLSELMGASSPLPANVAPDLSLMSPPTLSNLQTTPADSQNASSTSNPISVSRVQSAYAASAVVSATLFVTLTVKNNLSPLTLPPLDPNATLTDTLAALAAVNYDDDPNVLRNVILSDELLPEATLVSASRPADRNGDALVWNLGDIPPFGSESVALTLTVPAAVTDFTFLDEGAAAWGSRQHESVTAAAGPITLAPDGFEGWLTCTIDANCNDTYVIDQAAALGNDPVAIFDFVRELGYESYQGSLRGARGTLWSDAGNALDQASLLIALLRASGIPAAYRQGTLALAEQEQLIQSMFPPVGGVGGHVAADAFVATPTEDEQLLAETADHWWVEAYLSDGGWTQLDPSFATAAPGDAFATPIDSTRLAEAPDDQRHKVTIRLRVEDYHPLNISGSIPGLENSHPLNVTFNAVELIGEPVSLGHFVDSSAAGGLIFSTIQHTYVPYLIVGPDDEVIEGDAYQELLTNFPLGTIVLTGAWLEFELQMPGGSAELYEREIFDKVGYAARQGGGNVEFEAGSEGSGPSISDQSIYSTLFAPGAVVSDAINASYQEMVAAVTNGQATINSVQDILDAGEPTADDLPALQAAQQEVMQITRLGHRVHLLNFAAASDLGLERLGDTYLVKPYYDKPRVLSVAWEQDVQNDRSVIQFDLRQNEVRAIAYPGQSWTALQAFNFSRGVIDSSLEGILLEDLGEGAPVISVHHVFEAVEAANIPTALITPGNVADLAELAISDEAKARISEALLDQDMGKVAVVPTEMVTIGDQETIGWYLIDVIDGVTVDVMEDGQHTALVEYAGILKSGIQKFSLAIIGFFHGFSAYSLSFTGFIMEKMPFTEVDLKTAWDQSIKQAEDQVIKIAQRIGIAVGVVGGCFEGTPVGDALGWMDAYLNGAGFKKTFEFDFGDIWGALDDFDDAVDIPDYIECLSAPGPDTSPGNIATIGSSFGGDIDDLRVEISINVGGFVNGANFAKAMIDGRVDPPVPGALFSRTRANFGEPAVVQGEVDGSATLAGGSIAADLTTNHVALSGDVNGQATLGAANTFAFTELSAGSATLLADNGTVLGNGSVSALPASGSALATLASPGVTAATGGTDGAISFHAPAVAGLGSGTVWQAYATDLSAGGSYSVTLSNSVVTLDTGDVFTGSFTLVTAGNVSLSGAGTTAAPNFAASSNVQLSGARVNVGPASGVLTVGGLAADPSSGVALADFTGTLTVTEVSTATNAVSLSGSGDYFTLATAPISSTVLPGAPATFETTIDATYSDSYTVTVTAPAGWDVELSASGRVSVTAPVGTTPDDYPIFVSAQTKQYGAIFATAKHTVTTLPVQGLELTVAPDPQFTVGLGEPATGADANDTNNGSIQLPDAAFSIALSNTSTVSHTFSVELSGLPSEWVIFAGSEGQTDTTVTIEAGGTAEVGLYLSPTLPLPAAGTPYNFSVSASDLDGAGLAESEAAVFTVPAVPFAHLQAAPNRLFAAAGETVAADLFLTNVGNAAAEFPISATVPVSWGVSGLSSPINVAAGETVTQTALIGVPAGAVLGRSYPVQFDTRAPGSEYVQRASTTVEIVSANALPIFEASETVAGACAVAGSELSLPVALDALATAMNGLEQSCQSGPCDLNLRDRTVAAANGVAEEAAGVSSLLTSGPLLEQIAADMSTHTTSAELQADNEALRDAVVLLEGEVCAVARHDVSATFVPGTAVVLDGGNPVTYTLRLENHGSLSTTAALTLSLPAQLSGSWSTQSYLLGPGDVVTVPTTITPSTLGLFTFMADLTTAESTLIRRQAAATLNVVDAFVRVLRVRANPDFVETGVSSTTLSVDVANVANVYQAAVAHTEIISPDGSVQYTADTPLDIHTGSPRTHSLGTVDTSGWASGLYTISVELQDAAGTLIPYGSGVGYLAVGQAIRATSRAEPNTVAPGDATATTIIDTERTDTLSTTVSSLVATAPDAVNPGDAFSVTVTVFDSLGAVATDFSGIVELTSSDSNSNFPVKHRFTPQVDQGTFTFTGLAFGTAGEQTFTANAGFASDSHSITVNDNVVITQNTVWDLEQISLTSLEVSGSATLSLVGTTTIAADSIAVAAGATMAADGSGHGAGSGPGAPGPRGSSGVAASGAGHGGFGGTGRGSASPGGAPYGDPFRPTSLGSGGANGDGAGGAGGGAIHLVVANNVTVDGIISANGSNGSASSFDGAGGGAGGSIWIESPATGGAGTIRANGGAGGNTSDDGGGGAGGRIAVHSASNSFSGAYQAAGGFGNQYGGPGTVYLADGASAGELLVDNAGNNGQSAGLLPGNYQFDTVTLTGEGDLTVIDVSSVITLTNNNITGDGTGRLIVPGTIVAPSNFTIDGVTVVVQGRLSGPTDITTAGSGGLDLYASTPWHSGVYLFNSLTVGANTAVTARPFVTNDGNDADDYSIQLQLNDLTVEAGGALQATGVGYAAANGPGAPGPRGSSGVAASGAGHGGFGGAGRGSASPGGDPYGDPFRPTSLGSGGANGDGSGGAGGGAIHLVVANNVTVDGIIAADGANGSATSFDGAGGGAGGSIWIETPAIGGSGAIRASGGAGGNTSDDGGGGAGGRIAVHSASNSFSGAYQAAGGFGNQYGGPGTVYLTDGASAGQLLVDNAGNNGQSAGLLPGNYEFDTVTLTAQGDLTVIDATSTITLTNNNITGDGTGRLIVPGTIVAPSNFTIDGVTVVVQGRLSGPTDITTTGSGGLDLYASTPWHSGTYTFTSLTIGANTTVIGRAFVSNDGDDGDDFGLTLQLDDLTVEAGGALQANGVGYAAANGPGAPGPRGSSGVAASGAGYGGFGGAGRGSASPGGSPYGDPFRPTSLGSGGANGDGAGGAGGGAIHLVVANNVTVDGLISADGANGSATSFDGAGGGSGGSIWIETPAIGGSGAIRANGGAGGNTSDDGGGGAGGRIAVHSASNSFSGAYQAVGGFGNQYGGPGTVYLTDAASAGELLVDNAGNDGQSAALLPGDYEFDTVTLTAQGDLTVIGKTSVMTLTNSNITGDGSGRLVVPGTIVAPANFTIDGVTVVVQGRLSGPTDITTTGSGGLDLYASTPWHSGTYTFTSLTIGANTTVIGRAFVSNDGDDGDDFGLTLQLDDLTVETGGALQANGVGYAAANGPGAPGPRGSSGVAASGAGHGGFGGAGRGSASPGGDPYGDPFQPTSLGSGGANGDGSGGAGGGAIHLVVANNVTVDGIIAADGANGSATSFDGAGGGAGGSIWIETPAIGGSGAIRASGGAGGNTSDDGGGGAGGRIAVHSASNSFSGAYQAAGGFGNQYGGPGTVYLTDGVSAGELLVDNAGNNGQSAGLLPGDYEFDTVTLTAQGDLTVIGQTSVMTLTNSNITGDGTGRLIVPGTIVAPSNFTIDGVTVVVQGRLSGPTDITTAGSGGLDLYASTPWHSGVYLFNSLTVGANTAVTARPFVTNDGNDADDYDIELRLNELTVESGGTIQANAVGYAAANGPGAPGPRGSSGVAASGAGHGGFGGTGQGSSSPGGSPYGDPVRPTAPGSGGANGDGAGGAGGGAIHLVVANNVTVDGIIAADGANGSATSFDGAGGGSGGSIWIETPAIGGAGTIRANGGAGGNTSDDGGGGAGGRIAVHASSTFTGTLQVAGGAGFEAGEDGTIYTDTFAVPTATVGLAPTTAVADGATAISVTVTVPLSGTDVALRVSPQEGVYVNGQPANAYTFAGTSGSDGTVTAAITSTTTGEKVIVAQVVGQDSRLAVDNVLFVPGAVDAEASQLAADKTAVVADDVDAATITATLFDSYGHPVPGKTVDVQATGTDVTVSQPEAVTDEMGQVTASIRSGTVQDVLVTAVNQSDGITLTQALTISFVLGQADAANSTIEVAPTTVLADGAATTTITATLRDDVNRPLVNRTVELQVDGSDNTIGPATQQQTDGSGVAVFTLASGAVETKNLSVRDVAFDVAIPAGTVTFVAGEADAAASQVTADKTVVLADGVDAATVTARLTDASGNPLPGREVIIQAAGSAGLSLNQPMTVTDEAGEVRAILQSTDVQTVTVSAYDQTDALTLTQTVDVAFVVGQLDAANSTVSVSPRTVPADGAATVTIDAALHDAAGHPLANRPVELQVSGNANTILPAVSTTTDGSGAVTFSLSSTWAQVKTVAIRDVQYDAILPLGTVNFAGTQATGIVRHEEYDDGIAYNGQPFASAPPTWELANEPLLSAGYAARSRTAGDAITFDFNGSWLNLGFLACRECGRAEIFIDSVSQGIVDTYSGEADAIAVVYNGLGSGSHTVTIDVLGTHALGAAGDWIHLDYIDVWDDAALPTGRFEHDDAVVTFSNDWNIDSNTSASAGSYVRDGSNAWFHFTGESVTVQPLTFNGAGWVEILIDNGSEGIFNLNNNTTVSRSISFDGLGPGAHVLQIKADQGPAAVDAFVTPGSAPFHQTYTLELTPAVDTGSGLPGDTVNFELTLRNTGSKTDSYTVATAGNDWSTTAPTAVGPLTPGQVGTVPVTVDIPPGVPGGTNDTISVTVTSTADPAVSAAAAINTYAVQVDVQLCMTLDGSGSISGSEFALMIDGLAAAIRDPEAIAADGSVEISVSQFAGSSARTELAPIVIVDEVTREQVASQIEAINQMGGGTPTYAGINQCAALITGSDNFVDAEKQVINIATDGEPTAGSPDPETAAVNARINAVNAGIDEVNAEAVGVTANGITFLRDQLVYPQPGYEAPPYIEGRGGFIVIIDTFDDFAESIRQKLQFVVQVGYSVDVTHTVPVTAVDILSPTISPLPDRQITGTTQTDLFWSYFLSVDEPFRRLTFDALLPGMEPGEVRQVADGTDVVYSLPSGQNRLALPPLYVSAAHLVAITPPTQTVPLNGLATYDVVLQNPGTVPLTLTLTVAGLPAAWIDFPTELALAAGDSVTVPLAVRPEGNAGLYDFSVIVQTDSGGQDQAGASLEVTEPALDLVVSPKIGYANHVDPVVDYTVTISNLESITRTYHLSTTGLEESLVTVPATATVAGGGAVTATLTFTSYESVGPHSFIVTAAHSGTGTVAADDAALVMLADRQVRAALSPATAVGGPGVPVTYTLTVTNSGDVADTYGFDVSLPAGWTYTLQANGQDVTTLSLAPYLFNSAELILTVTPAPGTVPGDYDVDVTVQSLSNPAVSAPVSATLTVLDRGVDVELEPASTTLNPADTGVWNVTLTNLGAVADTYTLYAGGVVASSGSFSQNPVSLAPGASQTVQLTADQLEFALPGTYPVDAVAVSTNDSRIYDRDTADVIFEGYEAVSVRWEPVSQTITDTDTATYMMVISNTGNLSAFFDLRVAAPGLQVEVSQERVYIPRHLAAAVLVTARASTAGTFTLAGQADSTTSGATDTSEATLIVEPRAVSQPPTAVDDEVTTAEDTPVIVDVLANDVDPDGDALTVISTTQPLSGTAVVNADNTVTYSPAPEFSGTDAFTYTIADVYGDSDTALATITVTPVNDPPDAVDDAATTPEDTPVTVDVLANDSDVEGEALSVVAVTQPGNGTSEVNLDHTVTYTPAMDYNSTDSLDGVDAFSYTVRDESGATSTATVSITVTPVNDPPEAEDDTANTNEDSPVTVDVLANDFDVDGDLISVTAVGAPSNGTVAINLDNTVTYTPAVNFAGADSFTYTISDGKGEEDTAIVTVTVAPVNDAPQAVDDTATTDEDTAVTVDVLANDSDVDGDALTVTAVTTPTNGTAAINPDGSVTYTPTANFNGSDTFAYTIHDGQGGEDTAAVTVTVNPVNDDPVAADDSVSTAEDTAVTIAVLANDSDVDGDALTVTAVTTPTNGAAAVNLDSTVTYTPALNFDGVDTFAYTISDGQGGEDTAVVTVTVTSENDNPTAVDDTATTNEDEAVTVDVLANDSDVDGDPLAVSGVTQPAHGVVAVNVDNSVTYTPTANYHGSDSFTYTVNDGQGGSATAAVFVTVNPVNDNPVAVDDNVTTNEDLPITIDVLDNDSDVDGDPLAVGDLTQPAHGVAVVNLDNTVTYTPTADYHGADTFTYTVDDGQSGNATATVSITVNPVNDNPVAANDTATTDEDTAVTVDVLANDFDVDGDSLSVSAVTTPTQGTVALNGDDTITYTPDPNTNGADSFSYTIVDGQGGSDMANVTIAVDPVNDPPVAVDDAVTTGEDVPVTVAVLSNDSDVDGDTLTVQSATSPANGTAVIQPDDTIVYTPTANFNGVDSFTYTINDGHGSIDTASVTVTVEPVNDAPQAADDTSTTPEETAATIDVLENDVDVDGDALAVTDVTEPANGTAAVNPDQTVTYTPTVNFNGTDSFVYTVDDGQGGSDTATVTVTVTDENDNPVAVDDAATTAEDTIAIIPVLDNDFDVDGDSLTVTAVTTPTHGVVALNPDNSMTYTPTANFYGSDSFAYTISDGRGGSDTAMVTITVEAVNDDPVAADDSATTNQGTAVTLDVLANDSDVDGDALSISSLSSPAHGDAELNADDTVTYTPDGSFVGVDSFTYTVSDGQGGSDTATVSVSVLPVSAACELYPIALSHDLLAGANAGDILSDIMNGEQPGNFGWLTWNGNNNVPALIASLTPPGNSHIYNNPDDSDDHSVSIGDWVEGKPGVSNAKGVRDALDVLIGMEIIIPIWDEVQGSGANAAYRITGFARVRLVDYHLPGQDRITAEFLGYASCFSE